MDKTNPPSEQPPKKGHGCLIAFLIFLFLILLFLGGIYWAYKKISSELTNQVNLNIAYTQDDLTNLIQELGTSTLIAENTGTPQNLDLTLTSAQATALANLNQKENTDFTLSNTQIRFGDNEIEASSMVTLKGYTFPVYLAGNTTKASSNTLAVNLYDVKVGNLSIPRSLQDYVENLAETIVNEKLTELGDAVRIDSIQITSAGLDIKGILPIGE